jgi:hypothetical protein
MKQNELVQFLIAFSGFMGRKSDYLDPINRLLMERFAAVWILRENHENPEDYDNELLHKFINWYNENHGTHIPNSEIGKFNLDKEK